MSTRVFTVALEGLKARAKAKAEASPQHGATGKAYTRLVAVFYYPVSKRFAYFGREGRISRSEALWELEREAKLDA